MLPKVCKTVNIKGRNDSECKVSEGEQCTEKSVQSRAAESVVGGADFTATDKVS